MNYKNKEYRNIVDQVDYLTKMLSQATDVVKQVVGQVDTVAELPTPSVDKIGDTYAVGTTSPYEYYVNLGDRWLDIGMFPGKGDKGDQGDSGYSTLYCYDVTTPTTTNILKASIIKQVDYVVKNGDIIVSKSGMFYEVIGQEAISYKVTYLFNLFEDSIFTGTTKIENVIVSGDATLNHVTCNDLTVPDPIGLTDATNKKYVDEQVSSKADTSGVYPNLTSGSTYQLLSKSALDDDSTYKKRLSGGDKNVLTGPAVVSKIYGKSYVVNQMLQDPFFDDSAKWTKIGNASGTIIANNQCYFVPDNTQLSTLTCNTSTIKGHKYRFQVDMKLNSTYSGTNLYALFYPYSVTGKQFIVAENDTEWHTYYIEFVVNESQLNKNLFQVGRRDVSDSAVAWTCKNAQMIDLSLGDVKELASYNTGEIVSLNNLSMTTNGLNQMNDELLVNKGFTKVSDHIFSISGSPITSIIWTNDIDYKGQMYVMCKLKSPLNNLQLRYVYDDDTTSVIQCSSFSSEEFMSMDINNKSIANKQVKHIDIVYIGLQSAVIKDISIIYSITNLYDNVYNDYFSNTHTFTLSNNLYSIDNTKDILDYEMQRKISNVKMIDDLSLLGWSKYSNGWFACTLPSDMKPGDNDNSIGNILCDKLACDTYNNAFNGTIDNSICYNATYLAIRMNQASDVESLKTLIKNVRLLYILTNTISTPIVVGTDNIYNIHSNGLESLSEEVRIETKYQRDMNDDILRLDYDYLSKQSLDSLLLALKNKGIEISYTFDYSTNTYKFI